MYAKTAFLITRVVGQNLFFFFFLYFLPPFSGGIEGQRQGSGALPLSLPKKRHGYVITFPFPITTRIPLTLSDVPHDGNSVISDQ
ncbi:hypothetical protein M434DRAFT_321220 [Hypoxylon sp. CO27-5]|nr:hypothetical protein M434DRAFT_321220 [Hypoxylon sp. CO27-5]